MAKQFSDKLKLLKDIANGKQSLSKLMKPKWITVHVYGEVGKEERIYEIDRKQYNQQEYDQWKAEQDESSTIIHFLEILDYSGKGLGNAPIEDIECTRPIMVPVEVKVDQLGVEEEIVQKKTEPCIEPVIEPRLRPYADHVRFNEMMMEKLFG
jgi:hypothetical protein